jgi:hypothetical protein
MQNWKYEIKDKIRKEKNNKPVNNTNKRVSSIL